ncbi:MAG: hypothetical protein ACI82O_000639 [Patiriisocius sp.]|jgi:hypothetical protein
MKSILTIHGNLLLLNLVVIGLILWLAISFLHIAVVQRSEAVQLQADVDAERTVFRASNALVRERDRFDEFLNSPNKPTARQYQQLKSAESESDATLQKITKQVIHRITELQLFEHFPEKRSILQKQLKDLKIQRLKLVDYRRASLSKHLQTTESSGYVLPGQLFESQTDTIEVLVGLAKSLRYLPEGNAPGNFKLSSVDQYGSCHRRRLSAEKHSAE